MFVSTRLCLLLLCVFFLHFCDGAYGPELTQYQVTIELASQSNWYSACESSSSPSGYTIRSGKDSSCAATGYFFDDLYGTNGGGGWTYFRVISNANFPDEEQSFAAGYLEGGLLHKRIYTHMYNAMADQFDHQINLSLPVLDAPNNQFIPQLIMNFTLAQREWNLQQVASNNQTDTFWRQTGLVYAQLQGVYAGYQDVAPPATSIPDFNWFLLLNLAADLDDITAAIVPTVYMDRLNAQYPEDFPHWRKLITRSRCSSLVRWTSDHSELFHGHTTWSTWAYLTRTYKLYELNLENTPGVTIHFASYPGVLTSFDDFFQVGETLLSISETTMSVINTTIYSNVVPETVPYWIRSIVANRLAVSGPTWADQFVKYNSGTYNNQWLIVDHKLFIPQAPFLKTDLFWIVTQAPGLTQAADLTQYLQTNGYYSSYNIPYFPEMYSYFGYTEYVNNPNDGGSFLWSYESNFRALAFKALAPQVEDLQGMQNILTHNDYQHDSFSANCSGLAISARHDLQTSACPAWWGPEWTSASGGFDCKITCFSFMQRLEASINTGPSHGTQSPFQFSTAKLSKPIYTLDLPDLYNFPFVRVWQV